MIGLSRRAAWFSLALLPICIGHASAQVPATISASFAPSTVVVGNTSILTITVSNPNVTALTNVAFSDTLPAGLSLITETGGTCGTVATGGGSTTLTFPSSFSNQSNSLAGGASCNVALRVMATSAGMFTDTTSTVTSNEAAAGTAASATLTVNALAATSFSITGPGSVQVFQQETLTINCLDQNGVLFTGYNGTVNLTSTADPNLLYSSGNPLTLTNGTLNFNVSPKKSGVFTVTATDSVNSSLTGTSNAITALPGPTTKFVVSAPSTATAGTAFTFTVTAVDLNNNTTPAYAGTVHFTTSDGAATLPADSTLTNGVGTFSATLKTAGNQTITSTDTTTPSISGTSGTVTVNAAAATKFVVTASSPQTAGTAFNITVTALDQFNNTSTGYVGTVHFTSTDASATLPANSTLTNGTGTFSVTLKTPGTRAITATDTVTSSITGTSSSITVNPAAATTFVVTAPTPHTAGTAFNFTVTALDQFANTATGYTGTVHFTSTDGLATLPADSTLTNGVGTFSVTLKTAGNQTITATDTLTPSITGTSNTITITPAAATHFSVSAPGSAVQNNAFNFTVTALDQFNNTSTGYAGTVHFTSSDGLATLPADSTLANGVGTFSATLKTAGNQTITATDTVTSSITGTSGNISVTSASLVVTTLADSGAGSLRAAITNANASSGGVTITFAVTGTINLLSALPVLTQSMTIAGPGASSLAIGGGGAVRVLSIGSGITVSISGVTIQNGTGPQGGGIYNAGTLTLSSCVVAGNVASGGLGGGIFNNATLALSQCTISNNSASGTGNGGLGGGLLNNGTATISNSTFSANVAHGGGTAGGQGGAIFNNSAPSLLTVTGSTIAGNTVTDPSNAGSGGGGAIYNLGTVVVGNSTISGNSQSGTFPSDFGGGIVVPLGTCTLTNTILAGNTDSDASPNPDGSGTFTDGGNNLIGISTGITGITNGTNGNQVGTSGSPLDPQLGALANNGGPTQTMLPSGNSPALGAGNPGGLQPATDQRGTGFLRVVHGVIDIGAAQLQGVALAATAGTPQSTGIGAAFPTALVATATESCAACASAVPGVTVTFTAPGSGASGTFAGGVNTAVTNSNGVATAAAFTADMIAGGPYNVTASATTPDQASPATASFSLTNTGGTGSKPVLTVTANNASKVTGAALPTFTATITGFVNGDTLAVVSGAPSLTTTATANSPAGSYPIIAAPGTLSAANYTFTFVNGTLTVTAPPPPPPQPATIAVVSGSGQSGTLGNALAAPLVAVVNDPFGNPVSGVVVSFSVFSGSATLSATNVTTGFNGTAQITATPTGGGSIIILASVSGLSKVATFFESGLAPTAPAQLSVLPPALTFTVVEGGGNPLPASIAVTNTGSGTLQWTASDSGNPAWLTLGPLSGSTPAVMTASINAAGLAAGSYSSTITVTSGSQHQTVGVTLMVVAATPAEFELTPAAVVVNAAAGSTTPITRVVEVLNAGTGTLSWTATPDSGSPWLSVSPASGSSASGNVPSSVTVQINPSGLAAGQYLGNIAFSSAGVAPANVAVVLNLSALPDLVSTVPLLEFRGLAGSSFAPQSLPVTTTNGAAVSFTATASMTHGTNWLSISSTSGATPGSIPVSVNTSGLAAGYYVAYISVQSTGAANTLLVPVVLDLGSTGVPGTLGAMPGGVLFTGSANSSSSAPLSQTIALSSDSAPFSWSAFALSGGTWLAVSPASGSGNGSITVTANLAGLQAGIYTGQVAIGATGTSNAGLIIPVTLIVTSGAKAVTSAATLQPIQPAGDFVATVGVPVALQASIVSSTGAAVTGATVQVAFTSGDAPVILTDVGGGNYTGVWTPLHSGAVSLLFTSANSPSGVVTGTVATTIGLPAFIAAGVVNAAPMISNVPLGVGSIATMFGLNLASQTAKAESFPLPVTLGGASVTINGVAAPLFYASPLQINFFVPYELAGQTAVTILVSTSTGVAEVTGVPITPASPGLFLTDAAGDAAVIHQNGQPVSAATPAAGGEIVEIFATGLGPVSNAPADDAAAPTNPLAMDQSVPVVTIGGVSAKVLFSGLAPGFAGLNQIDVVVPTGLPAGPTTLTIAVGPLFGNTAVIELR
jgi:uncharacterized protein (TIGR03437 family)